MSLRIKYMYAHRIKANCVAKVETNFFTTYLNGKARLFSDVLSGNKRTAVSWVM